MIAKCIIQHDLPFAYVEYERVRSIWKYLNEDVKFISRNTAAADVYNFYENEAENSKRELANLPGRISLTSDLWSTITQEGYMCLTAHYIDKNWKLNNKILAFCAVPPPHTCTHLAMEMLEKLKEWGIEKKKSIKYVQRSEHREVLFAKCVEYVGIKHKAGLLLDVQTRWNSTYKMLDRALKYRTAFANLKVIDGKNYKFFHTEDKWKRLNSLCDLLEPFDHVTTLISGSTYPTSNLYFMQVWKINNWLTVNEFSEDEVIRIIIVPMKEKFDKYWEEVSDLFAMTTVLDPRLKLTLANYCFGKLDKSSCQQKIEHLKNKVLVLNKYSVSVSGSGFIKNCRFWFWPDLNCRFWYFKFWFYNKLQDFLAFRKETVVASGKMSLQMYLDEPAINMKNFESLDILKYWKDNSQRYEELASMACDLLSIPITTIASESSFSIGARVSNKYRSCLLPKNVQALICSRNWLKGFEAYENEEEKGLIGEDEALPSFQSIVDEEETT
ncbi:PREDICTED: zinc finger BED domain-containing protein RICESLEEPER 3-like [Camelina sativa]|uniref:Zinc finger BED domain-containing protein RICESLEEPER 3-like n=1 Tax=Camelina sativa TaxID=90675 RepID=A0ABM1RBX6_CAMSA|nr:PREDICTED: zinc finger BED domain-containing protein RICESLEEPER 3-like [Camelina sativa]